MEGVGYKMKWRVQALSPLDRYLCGGLIVFNMGGMRATLPFLLLAALAHQTIASKCTAACVGNSGDVFNYQPGTIYKYEMDGSSVMSLAGADGDVAKMSVKVAADVAALPDCGFSVTLTSYQITDKDGKASTGELGQPATFTMNNGVVNTDVCTAKGESRDTLNVKRAIISLLQSSPETNSKTETDIFGTCPTDISVHKSGAKLKVKKNKNLGNCEHRQNLMIPFSSTHYHSSSDLQSIPWVSATQHVEQDVEGQVKWAMSKEEYEMPPAAGTETGGTIVVTTKLSLKGTGAGATPPAGIEKENSIILGLKEHSGENQVKNAGQLLKKICDGAQGEMDKENANRYAYLAYLLSRSNKATMTNLYSQVKQGQICADKETAKKVLLDAIFDSQSADGVQAMVELLKNKEVTGLKAKGWYASLGNVRHATLQSVKAVTALLDGDAPKEAYLGASSLLGRFCHTHNCDNIPEVNQLQKKLSAPLAKGCKAPTLAEEDKLLASIKGLGNSGYLSAASTKQLITCATDHSVRSRVRSTALDTLHSDPDKENIKKAAIAILKDTNEDSEMRIKAYLIIVECPCGKMAGIIKDVLDKEKSFQVGNFIVSHLRNLRASKNPDKAKAQAHFSGIVSPKSFPFDIRKYSTNGESSYMYDMLNIGGSAESNIIYSQKSWIPRIVSLNLTSQFFGNNFNFLELDVRAENLERMLERIIGPKGYLMGDPANIATDANSMWGKFMGRAKQTFRPKRGVSQNDIDALAKQVNMGADAHEKDESLDLSLKMFGSEVAWFPLHGAHLDSTPGESVDGAFNLLDSILDKAKNIDFDYTKHKILAEGVVAYPTAMGVPIKMKGVVSTALRVKMDGKLDIPAILRDPKNALVKFQLIPSGAVTGAVIAMMEAGGVNTGVKVSVTAHSSTGSDVTVRLLEGKGIDVKVGLPLAKQEVISIKSDIVSFSHSPQDKNIKPVTFNVKREEYSGCFDQISEEIGLTFCGEVSTPWEGARIISPAYGPSSLSARIEKEDPSLTNFHFKAYFNTQKDAPQHHLEIYFDTPNSKKERRFGVVVETTIEPDLAIKASVDSPFGGVKLDASAINSAAEKSINAELVWSPDEQYLFKAGFKQAGPNKYKPFLDYKAPEKAKSRFQAISGSKQGGGQAITVSGDVKVDGKKLIFEGVKVIISRQEYTLDGSVWEEPKTAGVDLKITYADDVIEILAKNEQIAPHHSKRTMKVASQKYADASVGGTWDLIHQHDKKKTHLKSDIAVTHGPDPNTEQAKITISNDYDAQYDSKGYPVKVDSKNSVEYPIVNLKGKLNFHGDHSKFGYDVDGAFETYKGGSSLEVVLGDQYSVDFTGNLLDNSIIAHTKRESVNPTKSKFTNSLELNPGGKFQLNALVTHKLEPDDIDAHLEAKITLPTEPKNIDIDAGIKDNPQAYNGVLQVNVGGKKFVDGTVDIIKGNEPNGNFKFVLPEYIDSNGKFKYSTSTLDANALVNLLKSNKKIEGKTHWTMSNPLYKGTTDLCLDSKCIKLSTESTIDKDNFDTKNKLELPAGLVVGLNAKCDEAKGTHSAEAELKGPDGKHTKVSYSSTRHLRPGDADVEYIAGIEDTAKTGAKPRRIEAKLVGKHIDLDKETGDGQIIITYHTPEDKDLSFHTNFKRAPGANDQWIHNAEVGATGSLIHSPLNLKYESEASNEFLSGDIAIDGSIPPANYHLTLTVGKDLTVESQGKTSGHTATNELNINLPQAKEGIKNFKWSTNNVVDLVPREGARLKFKTSNTVKWDDKFVKSNLEINEEDHGANWKADFETDKMAKKTISGNAHTCSLDQEGECKSDGTVVVSWDDKKADVSYSSEVDIAKKTGHIHLKGTSLGGTKFDFDSKGKFDHKGDNEYLISGESSATVGSRKYSGSAKIESHKNVFDLDFILDQPEGRNQFKSKNAKKSDHHYHSDFILKWVAHGGGSWVGNNDFNFENENSFNLEANMDSEVLNFNKFHFGTKVTPDKKLDIVVNNNGKTIAAAKTSYQYVADGSKRKVDGAGTLTINDKNFPLSFDVTLDAPKGVNSVLQMAMNIKAGDRTFKFTSEGQPDSFKMKRTYCKAPNDCSESQIAFENKHTGPLSYEHNIVYNIDLSLFSSKLNDFKLSSKIKREGLVYDQNFDVEWGDSKLHQNSYLHANKAGVSLALPQRTIAAEAAYGLPKKDKNAVKFEGSVWLDKAKAPNKKSHFVLLGEVSQNKDLYTVQGEAKFNHPSLSKPMIVKGKGSISNQLKPSGEGNFEIDIFKKPQMKIAGNWKLTGKSTDNGYDVHNVINVKSEGLKLNTNLDRKISVNKDGASWIEKITYTNAKGEAKEGLAKYELLPSKFHMVMKTTDAVFIDYLVKWAYTEDSVEFSEDLEFLGVKYSDHFDAKLHPLQANFKFVSNKGCGYKAVTMSTLYEMGKAAKLNVDFDGKSILNGEVSLAEADFLKPTTKYDKDVVNSFKDCYVKTGQHAQEELKKLLDKFETKFKEEYEARTHFLMEAVPNIDGVAKYYHDEFEKIQEEIMNDKAVQGVVDVIKESLSLFFESGAQTVEELHKVYNNLVDEIKHAMESISKTIHELGPKISKSFEDLVKAGGNLSDDVVHMLVHMCQLVIQEIDAHSDEITSIMKSIGDVIADYGHGLASYAFQLNKDVEEFTTSTVAKLKELPLGELLGEQIDTIKSFIEDPGFDQSMISALPQELLNILEDIITQLKQANTLPELDKLMETVRSWLEKVVKNEPVNHMEYAKKVAKELAELFKQLLKLVDEQVTTNEEAFGKTSLPTMHSLPFAKITPGLLKLSGLNWLASSDLPSLIQVITTYWPAANPDDWTPPFPARAYLLGGSEVITFDGSHISVGGECSYVLTQDYIDGNFSVVAQVKGGELLAIQVTDGTDTIELRHGKMPLVNGKESEFPIFQGEMKAWKRSSAVGLSTKSGLKILCTPDCQRCKFKLDGFYFGRVRGVLGTYDYEQFDDITMPSGEIAENNEQFLSSWAVGGGCAAQSPKPPKREATCTKTFTDAPDFMACYHLVNAKPYREACDSLAAKETTPEGLQATVCNVAFAYSLQCQNKIPTAVPSSCLKCTKTQTDIFQTSATFEPPFKKADVVFAVERYSNNKLVYDNLIKSLVQSVKSELAAKGISDVKFGLVGFGGAKRMWPAYYTNKGKILAEDLETGNLEFDPVKNDKVEEAIETAAAESGVTGKSTTYIDLAEFYPWRSGSSKVVLGVHSTPCKKSHALLMLQHLYYIGSYVNKGITFHTISPVQDLKLPGEDSKNILAISDDEVFTMNDAGKKPLEGNGNKEAEDKIEYGSDVCFTFAHMTGGNVFPSENFESHQDAYKQAVTTSIVDSLTSSSKQHTQKCSCHPKVNPYDGIFSQSDCRIINI